MLDHYAQRTRIERNVKISVFTFVFFHNQSHIVVAACYLDASTFALELHLIRRQSHSHTRHTVLLE